MCMSGLLAYIFRASGIHGVQKMASGHLELDLQMVVNLLVGAGSQTLVLYKNNKCLTAKPLFQL